MAVKRITETDGWVNGITHHRSPNRNGGMSVPAGVYGVLMHTMVGNLPGTDSVFMNPNYQASAHFGVAQNGKIIQWVGIRGGIAWHAVNANPNWYGIEFADNGNPGNRLTNAQINAGAQLVELLSRRRVGRFPLEVSNSPDVLGFGIHRMGGAAWGGHSCPQLADGSGPRRRQRWEILRRARIIREHGQYPAPAKWYWHSVDKYFTRDGVRATHTSGDVTIAGKKYYWHSVKGYFTRFAVKVNPPSGDAVWA